MAEKEVSKDEQIGFHKGALQTLAKEREEMARILGIVEQIMQMHVNALQGLGVDMAVEAEKAASQGEAPTKKRPIEDIL